MYFIRHNLSKIGVEISIENIFVLFILKGKKFKSSNSYNISIKMIKVTSFLNQYHFSRYLFQKSLIANSSFKDKILKISVKIKICFNIFFLPQLKKKLFSFNITHINEENSSTVKLEIY